MHVFEDCQMYVFMSLLFIRLILFARVDNHASQFQRNVGHGSGLKSEPFLTDPGAIFNTNVTCHQTTLPKHS